MRYINSHYLTFRVVSNCEHLITDCVILSQEHTRNVLCIWFVLHCVVFLRAAVKELIRSVCNCWICCKDVCDHVLYTGLHFRRLSRTLTQLVVNTQFGINRQKYFTFRAFVHVNISKCRVIIFINKKQKHYQHKRTLLKIVYYQLGHSLILISRPITIYGNV